MTLNPQEMDMPGKKFFPEQAIAKLRQIEVLTGQAVRAAGISEQGYYRWHKENGGLRLAGADGYPDIVHRNRAVLGKTATTRASTASPGMRV